MSAEIAGFDPKHHQMAYEVANSAAHIMRETGVSGARVWTDGVNGGNYAAQVFFSALKRMGRDDIPEDEFVRAVKSIEAETLPGKRLMENI